MLRARRTELRDVSVDVRRSLEILDDVLDQFDVEENTSNPESESISFGDLREIEEVPPDVKLSLDELDDYLDEFENDTGPQPGLNKHEDIRRSLEVLDSVLAEFDDCLDSWDSPTTYQNGSNSYEGTSEYQERLGRYETILLPATSDSFSLENRITDGSTSHSFEAKEQPKVSSPPPIPKRSPATRLSERNSALFTFLSDDTSLDSYDSASEGKDTGLSRQNHVVELISARSNRYDDDTGQEDDVFSLYKSDRETDHCANCGCELRHNFRKTSNRVTETKHMDSPFLQRKQLFEGRIAESATETPKGQALSRPLAGSSFRIKKLQKEFETSSEPSSLSISLESGFGSLRSSRSSEAPLSTKGAPAVSATHPATSIQYHAANCNCKERIRQLDLKFSETRRLLKLNKIKGLDQQPPSFVPSPPLTLGNQNENGSLPSSPKNQQTLLCTAPSPNGEFFRTAHESSCALPSSDSPPGTTHSNQGVYIKNGETGAFRTTDSILADDSGHCDDEVSPTRTEQFGLPNSPTRHRSHSLKLCNRCSKLVPIALSETIEDLPNLLPTDALNRPQLGLSYSMEDDLSPGVKEIRQTSTPQNGLSSLSRFSDPKEVSSVSTFSLSASSLGYVSSQSDLELNGLPATHKVPLTSLRSQTLPIGLNLNCPSPFYSGTDNSPESDSNDSRMHKNQKLSHVSTGDLQLRSSSAPPLPDVEKQKKKHFRGFSRKEKREKKNDDNISVKSDLSLDEGIILKRIQTLDGSSNETDAAGKTEIGVEKRRWSVWRSIMGKKQ